MSTLRTIMAVIGSLALFASVAGCDLVNGEEVAAERVPIGLGGGVVGGEAAFSSTVGPLLLEMCSECHNASSPTGGVDLTSYDALFARDGLVEPGDADASLLIQVLEGNVMPPPGRKRPTAEQINLVRAWVAAGAAND